MVAMTLAAIALSCGRAPAAQPTPGIPTIDRVFFEDEQGPGATPAASGRVVGLWFLNFEKRPLKVDTAHVRIELACLQFCSRRTTFALAATSAGIVVSHPGWFERPTAFVPVPIPSGVAWGVYRVRVVDDGQVVLSGEGRPERLPESFGFVSIPPAGWKFGIDANLRAARAQYVGKTVQGFGPIDVDCDDPNAATNVQGEVVPRPATTVDVGSEPSLVIAKIDRPKTAPLRWWKIGGPVYQRWSSEYHFTAVSPLEITFTAASLRKRKCTKPRLWVADTWELQRILWIHAPVGLGSYYTPIVAGMPKILVAHVLGFPDRFGTVADMLRLDTWELPPVLPPFHATVRFRNGRVSSYDPPGRPP